MKVDTALITTTPISISSPPWKSTRRW
jgi:hypothetical protein